MAAHILKAFAEAQRSCRLAVYADLSVPMVLLSEARDAAHRETLQALCVEGQAVLTAADETSLRSDTAIALVGDRLAVFLRMPLAPNDALCCLCDHGTDLGAFVVAARACLNQLAGGSG